MTVSSEQSRVQYATDGVATSFPVPFRFLSAQHLRVSFAQGDGDAVELVLGRDFDAVGVGNPSGGTVTTYTAYPAGGSIAIERVVPITQETAYQRNDPFPERAHEQALDKLTMICQMLGGYFGLTPGSIQRALTLGKHDRDGRGAYRARNNRITDLGDPQTDTDAVNRRSMFSFVVEYVDRAIAGVSGGFGWFLQKGLGAIYRPFQDKMRDVVSVRDYIATPVDGETSNQEGIVAAVAAAEQLGADLNWPAADGDYISTGNIPGFHRVRHTGCGVIRRGLNRWHITPRLDADVNTVFIADESAQGDENNDGLSDDFPRRYVDIPATVLSFAGKESAGTWRFQFAPGVIQTTGIRPINWPVFKNRLEFIGAQVPWNTKPTSIIDGTNSAEAYAFRAENSSSLLNLLFRDLLVRKFDNGTANSGGIILWNDCRVLTENLWIDDCPFGISTRYGYLRVLGGKVSNCLTLGIAVTYTATGNIGSLSTERDEGVTIENCNHGVDVGRHGICYMQKNTFIGNNYNIYASRYSRFRNQANRHVSWKRAAIYSAWSLHTPANGVQPDTYEQTPTADAPMYEHFRAEHLDMHTGPMLARHHMSDGALINIDNSAGQMIPLASRNGTWVPYRLPGGTLYANNWRLRLEFMVTFSSGAGGELSFSGAGTTESARLALINIAPVDGSKVAKVTFDLYPTTAAAGTCRYRVEVVGSSISLEARGTNSLNHSTIRSPDELLRLFRLNWTPSTNALATFYNLFTYIEA
ncbi:hypothetical protein Q9R35_00915 [Alcaligenes sp. AB3]|uniref:hypothetical protein n=1 Tax=Alcaligenes sp. AB3 TaxID=2962569 RepID=UPI002881CCA4|nr:hypothetical protein [Alcaligenes sp. AB3]MDT0215872.1 hypothetical protein [Alcaligenes sp. AB3]